MTKNRLRMLLFLQLRNMPARPKIIKFNSVILDMHVQLLSSLRQLTPRLCQRTKGTWPELDWLMQCSYIS